jgi:predicted acetyltransferase
MKDANNIKILPLEQKYLAQIEKWPSRHFAANTLLKKPVEPSGHQPGNYGWVSVGDDEVLAIVTLKLNKEHVGYINCIVKPGNKRQGIGTKIFEYALSQPEAKDLVHLHASVDPGNIPARQVLREQGFTLVGNDPDGNLEFAKHTHY